MYLDLDLHFSDAVSEAFYSPTSSIVPQILVREMCSETGYSVHDCPYLVDFEYPPRIARLFPDLTSFLTPSVHLSVL
jgi:hypothetical protein